MNERDSRFRDFLGGSGISAQVAIEASLAFLFSSSSSSFFFLIYYLTCETTGMTGWDGESLNISGRCSSSFFIFLSFPLSCFISWDGLSISSLGISW